MDNPFRLPEGPLTGASFVLFNWLSFVDTNTGKNCFATHTFTQIVHICAEHRELKQHIQYASIIQGGTVA